MSAPSRKLGSYEVGLSFLLLRFAEEAEIDEPLMGWLLQEVNAISTRGLSTLRHEMCRNEDGAEIWEILMSGLRSIDSPDALFDLFRSLESMICRELVSTSLMHSSGAFGQLARRLILSFKQASFEAIVKLYDSIQSVVMDFDDMENNLDETNESMCSMGVDDLKSAVPASRSRSLPEIPLSVGRLPFAVINATVQMSKMRLPSSHMAFLQYVTSAQHRFVDSAESSLRSFYDGKKLERDKRDSLPVQNVQNVQNALLTLATLNLEMRHVDDAFQALEDSIRAAQETSDASCLCACLYLLSILLQSGSQSSPSMASMSSSMMQRCLERSEALGLPLLQCLCCMGIARSLTVQPETRQTKRASGSTELGVGSQTGATGTLQTIQAVPSVSGMPTAATGSFGARMWGANGGNRQGSGLLTALSHGPTAGAAGREAFAHATMASLLSTAGSLQETRPKVLLCQAAISASFGLHSSARSTYKILLDTYRDSLTSEEHALALCQQLSPDESCLETLQKLKQELPHAGHVWVCSIMPKLCREMMSGSGASNASNATAVDLEALVLQSAGALRAVPQSLASDALLGWRIATNETRLYQGQLQAAMAACQSYQCNTLHPPSPELCKYLLNCCAIHLKAQNPAAALEPCMRCISIATKESLDIKAEAQLMLARLKLEQQDFQVLEAEMHLASLGHLGAKLRGELHLMQAEAFLELLARSDQTESQKLLESIIEKLKLAVSNFQAANVSSQEFYGHSHYLLARCFHQMGDVNARDHHAREFRLSRQVSRPEGSTENIPCPSLP